MDKEMSTSDFENVNDLWAWLRDRALEEFEFLTIDFGYRLAKVETVSAQCTIEYISESGEVGLWCSYGARPEIFVKQGMKRIFTDQLKGRVSFGQLPVKANVFGERTKKEDFERLLKAYAKIVRQYLSDLNPRAAKLKK